MDRKVDHGTAAAEPGIEHPITADLQIPVRWSGQKTPGRRAEHGAFVGDQTIDQCIERAKALHEGYRNKELPCLCGTAQSGDVTGVSAARLLDREGYPTSDQCRRDVRHVTVTAEGKGEIDGLVSDQAERVIVGPAAEPRRFTVPDLGIALGNCDDFHIRGQKGLDIERKVPMRNLEQGDLHGSGLGDRERPR